MKLLPFVFTLLVVTFSIQAQYEDSAVREALSYEFTSIERISSIEYRDGGSLCDLKADVYVVGRMSSRVWSYECEVCLLKDDNNFWDFYHYETQCYRERH